MCLALMGILSALSGLRFKKRQESMQLVRVIRNKSLQIVDPSAFSSPRSLRLALQYRILLSRRPDHLSDFKEPLLALASRYSCRVLNNGRFTNILCC
jgi:hypothetical protein